MASEREELNASYWDSRYVEKTFGWDIGYPSPALIEFASLYGKDAKILIPGCGHAYEGQWLWENGYENVHLLDFSPTAKESFLQRVPSFPENQFFIGDFFEHQDRYDLILEQTFYCALPPEMRDDYVVKMSELVVEGGSLGGLLFTFPLTESGPPFGGSIEEYERRFSPHFEIKKLGEAHNSIKPRSGKEAFFHVVKTA